MADAGWHVEPLSHKTLESLAECHIRCFPGYFLTNCGPRLVALFYEDFLESPIAMGFVAIDHATGMVVGFVTGNTDGPAYRQWSLWRQRGLRAKLLVGRLFCSIRLWGQVLLRAVRAAGSVLTRLAGKGGAGGLDPRDAKARLLSIGVLPEMRGSGVAAALIEQFENACRARGETRVGLSVFADNSRAIRFYEKSGWTRLEGLGPGVRFVKELTPKS